MPKRRKTTKSGVKAKRRADPARDKSEKFRTRLVFEDGRLRVVSLQPKTSKPAVNAI